MTELSVLSWSVISGIIAGFTYDVLRLKRKVVKSGIVTVQIEDGIFWIITCLVALITIQRSNDGEIKIYPLLAMFTGCFIYLTFTTKLINLIFKRTYKKLKTNKKTKKIKSC
jgi:spore cortex biosynthesis protein YabQ